MSNIGSIIDSGYSLMLDNSQFRTLHQVLPLKFTYLYTSQLLECIKAKLAIPRIQQHLDLGRKVVIFHSYNNSVPSHPFDIPYELYQKLPDSMSIKRELSLFGQLYPEYVELDLHGLSNPIDTIKKHFGVTKVAVFNGEESKENRDKAVRLFMRDDSFKDIILVQEDAGKEGISLHDTTSKHQRVTMFINLPTKPTTAIQGEGRTYREGLMSDAIYEYLVLHTNFEKLAFADKISKRVRTTENLAVGSNARSLELSFKEGYLNPSSIPPSLSQGKGGKESDMKVRIDDGFGVSLRYYRSSLEKGHKQLPEPIGYVMSRWLCANPNDSLLEPFAGRGSIGRFFGEDTSNDYLEPDINKRAVLSINVQRHNRILPHDIYHHPLRNKYYGIAFNEPSKGDIELCFRYLKDTGRIVAVTKGVEAFFQDNPSAVLRAEIYLPKALGYKRIMVIDKCIKEMVRKFMPEPVKHNLMGIDDMYRLFDELNKIEVPKRLVPDKII